MFVTYRGYRIERFGSGRVDVKNRETNRIVKMAKTWDEAIEWIDAKVAKKGENHDQEHTATAHN
jgi:hypothetical protein